MLKRTIFIISLVMLLSLALATATVDFYAESSVPSPMAGQSFNILVKLNVPTLELIKSAGFTLTPSSGVTFVRGTPGGIWSDSPSVNVPNAVGAYQYSQGTVSGTAATGSGLLLVTIPATVNAAGPATFTFSALSAASGRTTRTTTSTPLTITISPAASCTARAATCAQVGVSCPENAGIAMITCPAGQGCVDSQCQIIPPARQTRHQRLISSVNSLTENDVPSDWTPVFISRMARMFREVFAAR